MAGEDHLNKNHERLRLKIQPQPPKFPFSRHPFEITVYLVGESDHLKTGVVMPLQVDLLVGDKPVASDKPLVQIDPSTTPVINGDGMCRLLLSIEETSMTHGNKKFQFLLTPLGDFDVAPVMSTDMTCIRHRLIIQEDLPDLWYKDEGGRDKCMNLPVHLVDASNQTVGHRPVPLRVTLLYENEHAVLKQDILKLSPDSQRVIDSNGQALLKLRIEDVSKNHQGQAFRLKVEPDTAQSPLFFDVAPDWSTPISVRSKRNKRRGGGGGGASSHGLGASGIDPLGPDSPRENDDHGRPAKRQIMTANGGGVGSQPLHPSMEGVLQWTGSVINGLQQLEWQLIGYETKLDGSLDRDRPLYRCPACWRYKDMLTMDTQQHESKCLIANVLLTYMTDTVHHFDTLVKILDKHAPPLTPSNGNAPPPLSSMAATMGAPNLTRGITDMVNSLEVPPGLVRGASGALSEFIMGDGNDHGAYASSQQGGGYTGMGYMQMTPDLINAIERQVYLVVARMYALGPQTYAGFPAYDQAMQLLGFYQESQDGAAGTQITFSPINEFKGLSQQEMLNLQHMAQQALRDGSKDVFRLNECGNEVAKLKEKVMFYHWETKGHQHSHHHHPPPPSSHHQQQHARNPNWSL
ncbi:Aste57867_25083 [Aphanomyces stellatus]|uniref:Aste57867_25083 protein n=1 Tax=Aphanomyces stellatus TaxID=120398 RepID=A0A485LTJ6_9STRA|nr:hypothetical protein As57867_025005 [Aphanomyces stellatus]VFU01714.1 Aste57867_25083 [Aphanomyces stellatus]